MKHEIRMDAELGRVLWLSNGKTELAVALDVGIRILHFSVIGMPNVLYRQPSDLSDGLVMPEGWRIFGGHRFWTAPESPKSYFPDGKPVEYRLFENGVELIQPLDPWLNIEKTLRIEFQQDGSVSVLHSAKNLAENPVTMAAWGVSTCSGGTVTIPFTSPAGGFNPTAAISLWGDTSLADPRISFGKDSVCIQKTDEKAYFKMGFYCRDGKISLENAGQIFSIGIEPIAMKNCADNGVNIEVYIDRNVIELETLGEYSCVMPGACAKHKEIWNISPITGQGS